MTNEQPPDDSTANPYESPRAAGPRPASKMDRGLAALTISYVVSSILGCDCIFTYWMSLDLPTGFVRCVGYLVIMGGVHFVGYRLWKRQKEDKTPKSPKTPHVRHGLMWLLLFVLGFLLLGTLIL